MSNPLGEVVLGVKHREQAIMKTIKHYQDYLKQLHPHLIIELDQKKLKAFQDDLKAKTIQMVGDYDL